ncbi:ATP-dependent sacrificial sulfur transferase LarE [Candidatus Nitrosopelagicus sp.]|nr:ATP-dependent sacrificial sulfur transferase LarE [Candidatus Nitrosopelagicus sp.]
MKKYQDLLNWFSDKNSVLVSLSGGVDSALVAYAAFEKIGKNAVAVTADYKTLAEDELDSAKKITEEIGIRHILISYDELQNENFVRNDKNRCFYCRDELSEKLLVTSKKLGSDVIVDGTHVDDLGDYRPGIDALHKNGIKSPLVETNFTKQEIRKQTKTLGLTVYDRPSNSCLASRIPWGQRVTAEKLARVEMGELMIKQSIDVKQVRVRDLDGVAKIEVDLDKIPLLIDQQKIEEVSEKLQMIGFSSVIVDYDGYMPGKANI